MKKLFILVMLVLLSASVLGVGVFPASKQLLFEPGKDVQLDFKIINNENKNMKVGLYAKGDLANYVKLDSEVVEFRSTDLEKTVRYRLRMPDSLPPGDSVLSFFIVEVGDQSSLDENTVVQTKLGVIEKVIVQVPYPGQYLQGILFISDAKPNEKVSFSIALSSLGMQDIKNAEAIIDITSENQGISQFRTNAVSLKHGEKSKITGDWLANVPPGVYHARAVVNYDDKIIVLEKDFEVGDALIDIQNIQVAQFRLGTVAKFDISLKSKWNNPVIVNSNVLFYDKDSKQVGKYDINGVAIPAMSTSDIPAYWDTEGLEVGSYLINIKVSYLGKVLDRAFELNVTKDRIELVGSPFTGNVIAQEAENSEGSNFMPLFLIASAAILLAVIVFLMKKAARRSHASIPNASVPSHETAHAGPAHADAQFNMQEYIRHNMSQGISIHAIKQKLLQKGFSEEQIDKEILNTEDELR